ncbi:hypothetical protein D9M72_285780 [compost metagenome]
MAFAIILGRGLTGAANAAAPWTIDGDRVAFLPSCHAIAQGFDPSRILMAKCKWTAPAEAVVQDMKIGMTDACAADLHQDLPGTGYRLGQINDFRGTSRLDVSDCFHGNEDFIWR